MNSITVAGTIGKDAEVKYLANGDAICNFSVADSQGRDKPTIWWNCGLYGKRAESLSQYLVKGQAVTVTGSVSEREWTDKEGNKRSLTEILASNMQMLESKGQGRGQDAVMDEPMPTYGLGEPMPEDDVPF